jgi:chromosome segregation ATPase
MRRTIAVVDAVSQAEPLARSLLKARDELAATEAQQLTLNARYSELDNAVGNQDQILGALSHELSAGTRDRNDLDESLRDARPQLQRLSQSVADLQARLAAQPLSPTQRAALKAGDFPSTESLEREQRQLTDEMRNEDRFPVDVRDEAILGQRDAQKQTVNDVELLLNGRKRDLDEHQKRVDEARRRFDEHVAVLIRLLNTEFARICNSAGADGEVRSVAGDGPDDLGVDVLVAHKPEERRRSYRDASHSGGQRAKIAILLLLAAMSLGGAADLLVMDEHIAHLDSTNIDQIADLMTGLRTRVQFLLATPTNAEASRLGWCDLQIAFLPRQPGEPYTPPVRLLSRLGAEDLEHRFASSQLSLS